MFKKIILGVIKLYQATLSPDHGLMKIFFVRGCCRFYPSCSEYTAQAVQKYGTWVGVGLGLKRILRCNVISGGGYDPLIRTNHVH